MRSSGLIGDYVHYRNSAYREHGTINTTEKGVSNYSEATSVFQKYRTKLLRSIGQNKEDILYQGLEMFLNNLLYGNEEKTAGIKAEAWKKYQDSLDEILGKMYPQYKFVYDGVGIDAFLNLDPIEKNQQKITYDKLNQYLQRITDMVNGAVKFGRDYKSKKYLKEVDEIRIALEQFINSNKEGTGGKYVKLNTPQGKDMINLINRALSYQSFPGNEAKGDAFEYFLGAANLLVNNTQDNIVNEMEKLVVGKTGKSHATIQGSNFDSNLVKLEKVLNQEWQKLNDTNEFQVKLASQNKLDVTFRYTGEDFAISAKNYSFLSERQEVHILTGSNLLYLISNEDPLIVNHWLNLLSFTANKDDIPNNSSLLQLAHEAMKINILVKAFTGSGLGRGGEADTFIINMRAKRKILVRSMRSVVNDSIEYLKYIKFEGYPDNGLSQIYLGDSPDDAYAQQRITNLLKTVAQCQVSVKLPQQIFTRAL